MYSSPLIRAVQTAEIIAPQVKPVIDERLIEMDYGPYEGTDLTHLSPESQGRYWSKYIGNCAIYIATNADGRIGVPHELSEL